MIHQDSPKLDRVEIELGGLGTSAGKVWVWVKTARGAIAKSGGARNNRDQACTAKGECREGVGVGGKQTSILGHRCAQPQRAKERAPGGCEQLSTL